MLGMKGAALETDIWKIRLQLTKPVTWVPLIWGTYKASWKLVLILKRCGHQPEAICDQNRFCSITESTPV